MNFKRNISKLLSWKSLSLPSKVLRISILVIIAAVIIALNSKRFNAIKGLYILIINNLPIALCAIVWLILFYIWAGNRRTLTESTMLEGKATIVVLIFSNLFLLFYRNIANLAPIEKARIKTEDKRVLDSTVISKDNNFVLMKKSAQSELQKLRKDSVKLKESLYSITVVNNMVTEENKQLREVTLSTRNEYDSLAVIIDTLKQKLLECSLAKKDQPVVIEQKVVVAPPEEKAKPKKKSAGNQKQVEPKKETIFNSSKKRVWISPSH